MSDSQRGDSLIEVVVAVAIVAIASAALLSGTLGAARHFGPDAVSEALQRYVQREMRIAVDLLKYQGASLSPATVATTIPLPGASPVAVQVTLAVSPMPQGRTAVAITAQSATDQTKTFSMQTIIAHPAPLPSSTVESGLSVPAPAAAQ